MENSHSRFLSSITAKAPATPNLRTLLPLSSSCWWWEISATFVGIASIVGIVIFLSHIKDTLLAQWNISAQPSMIISVLATTGKSAMMIPIASCLGQYKWWRFRRPAKLEELQLLEEASRGPWGSLMLFFHLKSWEAPIALCLGLITVLATNFEPSAQQILSFPVREVRLSNSTAKIGMVTNREVSDGDDLRRKVLTINTNSITAFTQGVLGSPKQPDFSCPMPAKKCSWDDFTTLAVCGDLTDYTEDPNLRGAVHWTCWDYQGCGPLACNYTFPPGPSRTDNHNFSTTVTMRSNSPGLINTQMWSMVEDSGFYASKLAVVESSSFDHCEQAPPPVSLFVLTWRWCAKTFHNVTATPLGLNVSSVTEENLIVLDEETLLAESTGLTYWTNLQSVLDVVFDSHSAAINTFDALFFIAAYSSGVKELANSLAATFTGMVMSNDTMLGSPYLRMLEGSVYCEEAYIQVQWYWLIPLILEMALTIIFLVASIVLNRHQPIFKNSILPYLAHGLEGWEKGELDIKPPESTERLEEVLFNQMAVLGRAGDGQLKLRKC
ncbi:hypothetical protein Hte_003081 [Hypoxylon texense]